MQEIGGGGGVNGQSHCITAQSKRLRGVKRHSSVYSSTHCSSLVGINKSKEIWEENGERVSDYASQLNKYSTQQSVDMERRCRDCLYLHMTEPEPTLKTI